MPLPDAQLDPTNNVQGGFWRIVYTGVGPNPVKNWFGLVMPGDVRMEWNHGGGHSKSVLSSRNADGTITVYDNGTTALLAFTMRLTRRAQTRLASRFIGFTRNNKI